MALRSLFGVILLSILYGTGPAFGLYGDGLHGENVVNGGYGVFPPLPLWTCTGGGVCVTCGLTQNCTRNFVDFHTCTAACQNINVGLPQVHFQCLSGNACSSCRKDLGDCAADIESYPTDSECLLWTPCGAPPPPTAPPTDAPTTAAPTIVGYQCLEDGQMCSGCTEGGCAADIGLFDDRETCEASTTCISSNGQITSGWQCLGGAFCEQCDLENCAQDTGLYINMTTCAEATECTVPEEPGKYLWMCMRTLGDCTPCRPDYGECAVDVAKFSTKAVCEQRTQCGLSLPPPPGQMRWHCHSGVYGGAGCSECRYDLGQCSYPTYSNEYDCRMQSDCSGGVVEPRLRWQCVGSKDTQCTPCREDMGECYPYITTFPTEHECDSHTQCGYNELPKIVWQCDVVEHPVKYGMDFNFPCRSCVEGAQHGDCVPDLTIYQTEEECASYSYCDVSTPPPIMDQRWQCFGYGQCVSCRIDVGDCAADLHQFETRSQCEGNSQCGEPCVDIHPMCPYWFRYGHCYTHHFYMATTCPKSCNTCGYSPPSNGACKDEYMLCPYWALDGECNRNLMLADRCRLSCGTCQS